MDVGFNYNEPKLPQQVVFEEIYAEAAGGMLIQDPQVDMKAGLPVFRTSNGNNYVQRFIEIDCVRADAYGYVNLSKNIDFDLNTLAGRGLGKVNDSGEEVKIRLYDPVQVFENYGKVKIYFTSSFSSSYNVDFKIWLPVNEDWDVGSATVIGLTGQPIVGGNGDVIAKVVLGGVISEINKPSLPSDYELPSTIIVR